MAVNAAISKEAIEKLRGLVRGPLLTENDAVYEESRAVWNAMIDRRPTAIVRCLGVADVVACVNFAREHGLLICIKGGGHNIAGLAVSDGALMLDLSLMRGVWTDTVASVARAQAGCQLGDVDRETQLHGLAAVLGFVSSTGIAGLTLGGGFGYLSRRYGWTSDSVLAMEVVTADGRVVRASENENPDLFWGLRGGGGNFGVVTAFDYKLYPVGPRIVGGAIAWPAEDAPEVLEMYRNVVADAPPELVLVAGLRNAPPAPWLATDIYGKPIVLLIACHTGSVEEGEKLLAPLKAFGKPVGDVLGVRSYVSQQALLDSTQPRGRRYYWKSEYLPSVESEMLSKYMEHGARIQSPHSAMLLFPLDGAINRLAEDYSAAGNRDSGCVLNIAGAWEDPAEDEMHMDWARAAWRDMRQYSTGHTYLNFLTEEEGEDRVRDALGENFDRLVNIKSQWDPTNFFRTNKNIAPQPI